MTRYLDVNKAVAAGYVDIGLFVPHGWRYEGKARGRAFRRNAS